MRVVVSIGVRGGEKVSGLTMALFVLFFVYAIQIG